MSSHGEQQYTRAAKGFWPTASNEVLEGRRVFGELSLSSILW